MQRTVVGDRDRGLGIGALWSITTNTEKIVMHKGREHKNAEYGAML